MQHGCRWYTVELSKAKREKKKLLLEIKKLDQTFYETISVSI